MPVCYLLSNLSTKGYLKNSEFEEKFAYGRLYAHGDNIDKGKLILETVEDSFKHHEQVDSTKLSIEHIMPQTLTDWRKDHLSENYESDDESWLDNVGNPSLTGYNSEMSNYDFQTNKDILIVVI